MINRVKLGIMVLLAVFALVYVSEVRAEAIEKTADVSGAWAVTGQWAGGSPWNVTWTLTQKGKKIKGSSSSGATIKGKGKGSKITLKLSPGCEPIYKGTVSSTSMSGTMKCTTSSSSGTWSATKTADAAESSGASGAGSDAGPEE